jgi:hypothetical protein
MRDSKAATFLLGKASRQLVVEAQFAPIDLDNHQKQRVPAGNKARADLRSIYSIAILNPQ